MDDLRDTVCRGRNYRKRELSSTQYDMDTSLPGRDKKTTLVRANPIALLAPDYIMTKSLKDM